MMYPPVGPKSLPGPPENAENTGTPMSPINIYKAHDAVPHLQPSAYAEMYIPNIQIAIGTGLNGIVIDKGPSIQMIAVESAIIVISLIFKLLFIIILFHNFLICILRGIDYK